MDWIVLLPPVAAIGLAMWTRQVYLSLLFGILIGTVLLADGDLLLGLQGLFEQLVAVFSDSGNTRVIIFCLLVGGLIALVQVSGGVQGFIHWAQRKGWGRSRRGAELLAWGVGLVIFVESSITSLTVGAVSRPLFDTLNLPREKLAYYCDATSAPVCMMIPLNAWGAYVLGLLASQGITDGAVSLLVRALAFNFFSIGAIGFALALAVTGWSYGPMRSAERRARDRGELIRPGSHPLIAEEIADVKPVAGAPNHVRDLAIPIVVMVGMIFVGLFVTGRGNVMDGSGSTAVLWAVSAAVAAATVQYAIPRGGRPILTIGESMDWILKGSSGLVGVTILVVLAFALGQVARALEVGPYVVSLLGSGGSTWWLPSAVFLIGSFVSFTLGSSWTTFAIVLPVAMPLAEGMGISGPLMLGAVLSGGIFGDHTSPLSDTSIISSMSAACDHVDHVNSQMPYALTVAGLSCAAFAIAGLVT
ncbi:MAG: Na+/H+ antiporter NhaC family protein [Rhodothermales bacterium]